MTEADDLIAAHRQVEENRQSKKSGETREKLAKLQHEIWTHWMKYLFSECCYPLDGTAVISATSIERWKRQMYTHYSELTEKEKESDREQADKVLALLDEILCNPNS